MELCIVTVMCSAPIRQMAGPMSALSMIKNCKMTIREFIGCIVEWEHHLLRG